MTLARASQKAQKNKQANANKGNDLHTFKKQNTDNNDNNKYYCVYILFLFCFVVLHRQFASTEVN